MVDTADTLFYFSKERKKAIKAYREFVEKNGGREENPFKAMEGGLLLGDNRFKAKVRRLIDRVKVDEEIP